MNLRSVILKAAVLSAAFFFAYQAQAPARAANPAAKPSATPKLAKKTSGESSAKLETYQNLIQKAQNLTLQRDRLQASQVLIRGIQHEARGSQAHKELTKALDELTSMFYTEQAQNLFNLAESAIELRPKEAIDQLQEALQKEERNVAILKSLARVNLQLGDCGRAEGAVAQAEEINPYSPEVVLLRVQTLSCQQNFEALAVKLNASKEDLESVDKFTNGIRVAQYLREKDLKKARAAVLAWEGQTPDYPEVFYWKWRLSRDSGAPDRTAALRYSQLCQSLSARKRKSLSLDVDLCKGKEAVEAFLREGQATSADEGRDQEKNS